MCSKIAAIVMVLVGCMTALAQDKQDAEVLSILKAHCYQCHGTTRQDWDASSLESATEFADLIADMVESEAMPPGKLPKLSDTDRLSVVAWAVGKKPIEEPGAPIAETAAQPAEVAAYNGSRSTPPEPPAPRRQFLDDTWVLRQISADRGLTDSLYISLANLYNAGQTVQQLRDAQGAVAKAANLLSTSRNIVVPKKVDRNGLVLRVDVADLGWGADELNELLEAYPYAEVGFVRGDWFVSRALRAPLYYRLLGVPGTQADLDAAFGVDRGRFVSRAIAQRAAITDSRVAFHNRAVEWAPSVAGGVRLTYDTKNEEAKRRIVSNPLDFEHDATEYIADLPNGLHLYAAFNARGQRQNTVPENIASDPNQYSGSTTIIPGISCAACHKKGIQSPVNDVVRQGAPAVALNELVEIESLYPPQDQFAAIMSADEKRFLAANQQATEPFKSIEEPIGPTVLEYNKPLSIERVAQESNLSIARLENAIRRDPDLQVYGLRPLLEGQTITRFTWESLEAGQSPAQRVAQVLGRF